MAGSVISDRYQAQWGADFGALAAAGHAAERIGSGLRACRPDSAGKRCSARAVSARRMRCHRHRFDQNSSDRRSARHHHGNRTGRADSSQIELWARKTTDHYLKEGNSALLVERLVPTPALRRVHTGKATVLTTTVSNHPLGCGEPLPGRRVTTLSETCPAWNTVVHEDTWLDRYLHGMR